MTHRRRQRVVISLAALAATSIVIAGCSGGGGGDSSAAPGTGRRSAAAPALPAATRCDRGVPQYAHGRDALERPSILGSIPQVVLVVLGHSHRGT